jgi:glycosyl transferase, family 25
MATTSQAGDARGELPRVVVINLERSVERRRRMEATLSAAGLHAEFFPAVDGARGEHEAYPQYDPVASGRYYGMVMTPTEHACFASHWQVWQLCAAGTVPLVVCEDDVVVSPAFPRAIEVVGPLLEELGLVRLFASTPRPFRRVRPLAHGFELVRYPRAPSGAVCYALSPAAAARLLQHAPRWLEPVDRFMDRFWVHGLGHYALHPSPVALTAVDSDIGSRRRGRTRYHLLRRLLRAGDHLARLAYNLRHRD